MENVGIFYYHFDYFTAFWYTYLMAVLYCLCSFGIFSPFWYVWSKKNLATRFLTLFDLEVDVSVAKINTNFESTWMHFAVNTSVFRILGRKREKKNKNVINSLEYFFSAFKAKMWKNRKNQSQSNQQFWEAQKNNRHPCFILNRLFLSASGFYFLLPFCKLIVCSCILLHLYINLWTLKDIFVPMLSSSADLRKIRAECGATTRGTSFS
jgi:hypothetical protein